MTLATFKPGWQKVNFGDVVRLSKARSSDPIADGYDRYIGLDHIEPEDLRIRRWGNVADGVTFTSVFKPGQVLFGKRRAYQRKVAVADFAGVCSGDIYVLESKDPQKFLPELLPFICQTEAFFQHAVGTSAGSLSPRTNWTSLADFEFALPPLEEQRRIVNLLISIGSVIEAHEKALLHANVLLDSFIAKEFLTAKNTYPLERFDKICSRVTDGTHLPPKFIDEGIPFFLVSNLSSGQVDWNIQKWISESDYQSLTKSFQPQRGDVLLTLVGSYGVPVFVDWEHQFAFQRHIGIMRTNESRVRALYLCYFLKSPVGQWLCTRGAEGLAQKTITLATLKAFEMPVPPTNVQDEFLNEVSFIQTASKVAAKRRDQAQNLAKQTLESLIGGANVH
jgi:type I restriction enzyme S subunit